MSTIPQGYRRCSECGVIKVLNSENYRRKSERGRGGQPLWTGVCLECRPVTLAETAAEARRKVVQSMTKDQLKSMCEDKKRYPSRQHAFNAQMKYARAYKGSANRVYHCPVCGMYHISTKPRTSKEKP